VVVGGWDVALVALSSGKLLNFLSAKIGELTHAFRSPKLASITGANGRRISDWGFY
jgi:hypothetical protein